MYNWARLVAVMLATAVGMTVGAVAASATLGSAGRAGRIVVAAAAADPAEPTLPVPPALAPPVAKAAAQAAQLFATEQYQGLWEMWAAKLQDGITPAQLQALGEQLGKVQSVGQPQPVPGYPQSAVVVLGYATFKVDLTISVDDDGKVIGLFVRPHQEPTGVGPQAQAQDPATGQAQDPGTGETQDRASGQAQDQALAEAQGKASAQAQDQVQGQAQDEPLSPPPSLPLPAARWQAPAYAQSDRFAERTTTFGTPGWELGATFTYPTDRTEYPAVVLVHGSGPNDRDETIGPNLIFRDLAWGLASRGIAVCRYDKRTLVHGRKMAASGDVSPYSEVIDDARAAIGWVKQQPGVSRVYLVGHSLGAYLAPAIAAGLPAGSLAGLVLLAAPVRPLDELLLDQVEYLAKVDGTVTDAEKQAFAQVQAAVQALAAGQLPDDANFFGAPVRYWRSLRELAPLPIARHLDLPMLLLQGGRDYQVPATELAAWEEGLGQGTSQAQGQAEGGDGGEGGKGEDGGRGQDEGRKVRVESQLFPDLNHLFIAGSGASTPQEYEKLGHVAAEVIDAVARFISA